MTRENFKKQIDIIPDRFFNALADLLTVFITYGKIEDGNQSSEITAKEPELSRKKVPEKVTSISQLIGILPEMSLEEIKDMRLSE
jgi:hypothetical protein